MAYTEYKTDTKEESKKSIAQCKNTMVRSDGDELDIWVEQGSVRVKKEVEVCGISGSCMPGAVNNTHDSILTYSLSSLSLFVKCRVLKHNLCLNYLQIVHEMYLMEHYLKNMDLMK